MTGVRRQCTRLPSSVSEDLLPFDVGLLSSSLRDSADPPWKEDSWILVFLALCLPPFPALLKRSMPHNNEEVFPHLPYCQPATSLCFSLFTRSPWQHEVEVDIFCISDLQVWFFLCLKLIHLAHRSFSTKVFYFNFKKRIIFKP